MEIFPIKREGAAYNETSLGYSYPSATALRKAIKNASDGFFSIDGDKIPTPALESLKETQSRALAPIFTDGIGSDILSFFKLMSPDDIIARAVKKSGGGESVCCDGRGIVERLCSSAKASSDFNEMLGKAYTARYTDARINRVILFSLLGVSDAFEKSLPDHTTLLGASEKGRKYLSEIRKTRGFHVITKPADAPEGILTDIIRLSDSLYASAMPKGVNFDYFLKKHPFMG
jgi:predicted nucleotidyltransferase